MKKDTDNNPYLQRLKDECELDYREMVNQARQKEEEEAWNLNYLPKEKRDKILRKCDEYQKKIGSWRMWIPMYGIQCEHRGISSHPNLLYHASSTALIVGAAVYGLVKLVQSLTQ